MNNVVGAGRFNKITIPESGNGGEPPMNDLEARVRNLETDISVIKSNYATKTDIADLRVELHKSISSQTKWLAGTIIGVATISLAVAKIIF